PFSCAIHNGDTRGLLVEWPMVSLVAAKMRAGGSARIASTKNPNSSGCITRASSRLHDAETDALLRLERNSPVGAHGPERIVGDLPNMSVGIAKITGVAAPEGLVRRLENICAMGLQAIEDSVNFGFTSRVVGKGGAAVGGKVSRGDTEIVGHIRMRPQRQYEAAQIEENHAGRARFRFPSKRLFVKPHGARQIGDAEGDQTDALLHLSSA